MSTLGQIAILSIDKLSDPLSMPFYIVVLSAYILTESILALLKIYGGMQLFCVKAKYILACAAAMMIMWRAVIYPLNTPSLMVCAITIALFVWPRTIKRFEFYKKHKIWIV